MKQVLSAIVCFLFCLAVQAEEGGLRLAPEAVVAPGTVQLRWTVQAWEEGVTGVEVFRQLEGGTPELVNGGVIHPVVNVDRDWFSIDPHPKAQARLKAKAEAWLQQGVLQEESLAIALDRLVSSTPQALSLLAGQLGNSFDLACIRGFSLVDRQLPQPGTWTYALHAVRGEKTAAAASATITVEVESIQPEWMRLVGAVDKKGKQVQLKWLVQDYWPEEIVGFVVKRRAAEQQPWQPLHPGTIVPGVLKERHWENQGVVDRGKSAENEAQRMVRRVEQFVAEGRLKYATQEETLAMLHGAQLSELTSINVLTAMDLDRSLALGFGCLAAYDAPAEFGLFAVRADGSLEENPVSIQRVEPVRPNPFDGSFELGARKSRQGVAVHWSLAEPQVVARALAGYHVYRSNPGAALNFERLTPNAIVSLVKSDGRRIWRFIDGAADPDKSYVYGVAAVNHFGREFPRRTLSYAPALTAAERFARAGEVVITRTAMLDQGIEIHWDFAAEGEAHIDGVLIERAVLPEEKYEIVSRVLPGGQRSYVDEDELLMGEVYAYRVGLLGDKVVFRRSTPQKLLAFRAVLLPPPGDLVAQHAEHRGAAQVHLHWKRPAGTEEPDVSGYVVYADVVAEGQLARQGSVPLIDQEHFVFPMGSQRGRTYTFGVAAKSADNVVGNVAEVKCYIPANNLPAVSRVDVTGLEGGIRAKVRWEYGPHADLNGFEIYQNDTRVATMGEVAAHLRSWESAALEPNTLYEFRVIAKSNRLGASQHSRAVEHFYIRKSER